MLVYVMELRVVGFRLVYMAARRNLCVLGGGHVTRNDCCGRVSVYGF